PMPSGQSPAPTQKGLPRATRRRPDDETVSRVRLRPYGGARRFSARACEPTCAGSACPSGADGWCAANELARRQFARWSWAAATTRQAGVASFDPPPLYSFETRPAEVAGPACATTSFHDLYVVERAEIAVVYLGSNLIAHFHFVVHIRLVGGILHR